MEPKAVSPLPSRLWDRWPAPGPRGDMRGTSTLGGWVGSKDRNTRHTRTQAFTGIGAGANERAPTHAEVQLT